MYSSDGVCTDSSDMCTDSSDVCTASSGGLQYCFTESISITTIYALRVITNYNNKLQLLSA